MSKELNTRYPNVYRFIEAFKGFEKFYEENSNSGIDFTNFLLKLNMFDNFVTSVIEKIDLETGLELIKKIDSDPDFMLKAFEDKINKKNDLFFLTKNKSLVQISESSEETSKDSSDSDSDHSSVSSLQDINSNDSESDDKEEDELQNELTIQTNKLIASSLLELKIRKKERDFDTQKIEEE